MAIGQRENVVAGVRPEEVFHHLRARYLSEIPRLTRPVETRPCSL